MLIRKIWEIFLNILFALSNNLLHIFFYSKSHKLFKEDSYQQYQISYLDNNGKLLDISKSRDRFLDRNILAQFGLVGCTVFSFADESIAAPVGGEVIGGDANISASGLETNIHQQSNKALIDWKSFDINTNEIVNFKQPSSNAVAVNRIQSENGSKIMGQINSDGKVVLLNPNGIYFSKTARVDVGSLVASTVNLDEKNFLENDILAFSGIRNKDAKIFNAGTITAAQKGLVGLFASSVTNEGVIIADGGEVHLGSGDLFALDFYGDQKIKFAVSKNIEKSLIENKGMIKAAGGKVVLQSSSTKDIVDSLIYMKGGVVDISSVTTTDNGKIILSAKNNTTQKSESKSQVILDDAKLDASVKEGKGSEVIINADQIGLIGDTEINTTGYTGGGDIKIGGATRFGAAFTTEDLSVKIDETKIESASAKEIAKEDIIVKNKITPQQKPTMINSLDEIDDHEITEAEKIDLEFAKDNQHKNDGVEKSLSSNIDSISGLESGKNFADFKSANNIATSKDLAADVNLQHNDDQNISSLELKNNAYLESETNIASSEEQKDSINYYTENLEDIFNKKAEAVDIQANTKIFADAIYSGDGGEVIIWSDGITRYNGSISSKGGEHSGDGGFVETSGKEKLFAYGTVDASAIAGKNGIWSLDPNDITITTGANSNISGGPNFSSSDDGAILTVTSILASLDAGTDVTVQTNSETTNAESGNITVESAINKTAGGSATLTLRATENIIVCAGITSTSNSMNIIFHADRTDAGSGAINISSANIDSNGGDITMGGGIDPSLSAAVGTNNYGVNMYGCTRISAGIGNIQIRGHGVNTPGDFRGGIVANSTRINTTSGNIILIGEGGDATSRNRGFNTNFSTISSSSGDILIRGTGGNGTGSSNMGVLLNNSTILSTTGAGNITLCGTVQAGTSNNFGVNIGGASTSLVDGNISIYGDAKTGTVTGDNNRGVSLSNISVSGSGNIYVEGLAGDGTSTNIGTYLTSATITASSGSIYLTGTGGSSTNNDVGIQLTTSSKITSSAGSIKLSGIGGNSSGTGNIGVSLLSGSEISSSIATATTSAIVICGRVQGGSTANDGVFINLADVKTVGGDVIIIGSNTSNVTGSFNRGVVMYCAAIVSSSGSGNINITGTGGGGASENYAVLFNSSTISGTSGSINIFGTGGNGAGGLNMGVWVRASNKITSSAGSIRISGIGGTGINNYNHGAVLWSGSEISSSYTGENLDIIKICGQVISGNALNEGVEIYEADINTVDGNIIIVGDVSNVSLTGSDNHGVLYSNSNINSTGSGNIYLEGLAGDGTDNNIGILTSSSTISSTSGSISINGTGGDGTGVNNHGVRLDLFSKITSASSINITGVGGNGLNTWNYGVLLYRNSEISSTYSGVNTDIIRICGVVQGGNSLTVGTYLHSSIININDGNLIIVGDAKTGTVTANDNHGIIINNDSLLSSSGSGNIYLEGLAGDGSSTNIGISMTSSTITASSGSIYLTGTGGASTNNDVGLQLQSNSKITSSAGSIKLSGIGGNSSGRGNIGVSLLSNSEISSSIATATTSAVVICGRVQGGTSGNYGVLIDSADIKTVGGDVIIIGENSGATVTADQNHGVYLVSSANVTSTGSGAINITGTGGDGTSSNNGIYASSSTITSSSGSISLSGTGGDGSSVSNAGINYDNCSKIISASSINITGIGGDGPSNYNYGVLLYNGSEISSTYSGVNTDIIRICGVVQGGSTLTVGTIIYSSIINSNDGNIIIFGDSKTGNITGANAHGIYFYNSIVTSTGSGNIYSEGLAGDGSSTNFGISMAASTITSTSGSIYLTGTGGSSTNNDVGIQLQTSSKITSSAGSIKLSGIGGNSSGTGNIGVSLLSNSEISSSIAAATTSAVVICGRVQAGTSSNYGIGIISSTVRAVAGNIYMVGDNSAATTTADNNYGVAILNSALVTTTSGDIRMIGYGGAGTLSNAGIGVINAGTVTSSSGDIHFTGTGGSGNNILNNGVYLYNNGIVSSTGTGASASTITMCGTTKAGGTSNEGINLYFSGKIETVDGDITLYGDNTGNISGSNNNGIDLSLGSYITASGSASITLEGEGALSGTSANLGVRIICATISSTSGSINITGTGGSGSDGSQLFGVYVVGSSKITSSAGSIKISGVGGSGSGANNHGVYIATESEISSSIATTTTSAVVICGRVQAGTSSNFGVYLDNAAVKSSAGDVIIIGDNSAATVTADNNDAVRIISAFIASTSGNINVTGIAGDGTSSNQGIALASSSYISSSSGNINLSGIGDGDSNLNSGLWLGTQSYVESTGTGASAANITICGVVRGGSNSNYGLRLTNSSYINSDDGNIAIYGDAKTGTFTASNNHGVYLTTSAFITSTGCGAITVTGTGGDGTSANHGIILSTSNIVGVSGAITLTGTGGTGTSDDNDHGVYILDTANISANGPAQINITGSANGANGIGVYMDQSITIGGSNATGSVVIFGNTIDVSNVIMQSTGDVNITATSGPIHAGSYAWDAYTLTGACVALTSMEGIGSAGAPLTPTATSMVFAASGVVDILEPDGLSSLSGSNTTGTTNIVTTSGNITVTSVNIGGDFLVTTATGSITQSSGAVTKSTGADANLYYSAYDNIIVAGSGDIISTNNALNITFHADSDDNDDGAISISSANIDSNGGNITLGGGTDPTQSAAVGNATYLHGINLLTTNISSGIGNVSMRSKGRNGAGSYVYGIYATSSNLNTTSGNITLIGEASGNNSANFGFWFFASPISSSSGNILISGTGGNGSGDRNEGVRLGTINSTGTGSSAATITICGTVQGGSSANYGIRASTITTIDGDVFLYGDAKTGTLTADQNYGVNLANITATGCANIYVEGLAGDGTSTNIGISLATATTITASSGSIYLTGTGGSSTNNDVGIQLSTSSKITSSAGSIKLSGVGGNSTGTGNIGVSLLSASEISSSIATATTSAVVICGRVQAGTSSNFGVYLDSADINTVGGDVIIIGDNTSTVTADQNHGVYLASSANVASTGTGNINITGTGGHGSLNNRGIFTTTATISATSGSITLTGTGGSGTTGTTGIHLQGSTKITNSVGSIHLAGLSGNGTNFNYGVYADANVEISAAYAGAPTDIITICGNIQSGGDFNYGIDFRSITIKADGGNIVIVGEHSGSVVTGNANRGINISMSSVIESTGCGQINMTGTGGNGNDSNAGIGAHSLSIIAVSGAVNLIGTGGNGNDLNSGITLTNGSDISANGPAQINITGSANGVNAIGVYADSANVIGGTGATGSVVISANNILFSGTTVQTTGDISITSTTGAIDAGGYDWSAYTISGASVGLVSNIGIGSAGAPLSMTAATVNITASGNVYLLEADGMSLAASITGAGSLDAQTTNGNIELLGVTVPGSAVINAGTSITQGSGSFTTTSGTARLTASAAIGASGAALSTTISDAIITVGTDLYISESDGIIINSASTISGGGDVNITTSTGNIQYENINVGANSVTLSAVSGSITQNSGSLTADSANLTASASIGSSGTRFATDVSRAIVATDGNLYITETDGIVVQGTASGIIDVATTSGNITLAGLAGGDCAVINSSDGILNESGVLVATSATLTSSATIGTSGTRVGLTVANLVFTSGNDMYFTESDQLIFNGTASGTIDGQISGSAIIASDLTSQGSVKLDVVGSLRSSGNITMTSNNNPIFFKADTDIIFEGTDGANEVTLDAGNGDIILVADDTAGIGMFEGLGGNGNLNFNSFTELTTTGDVYLYSFRESLTTLDGTINGTNMASQLITFETTYPTSLGTGGFNIFYQTTEAGLTYTQIDSLLGSLNNVLENVSDFSPITKITSPISQVMKVMSKEEVVYKFNHIEFSEKLLKDNLDLGKRTSPEYKEKEKEKNKSASTNKNSEVSEDDKTTLKENCRDTENGIVCDED